MTFLGQACALVETGGKRILTDPWLMDPVFEGHVERDPPFAFGPDDLPPIDAIALTHGHLDHFNAPSLLALAAPGLPVVHPPIRFTEADSNLRRLGFDTLHARADFEPFELGAGVRIVPTPSRGVLDECAYLIEGPEGRFWNGADAPQPPEVIEEIRDRFGPIDVGSFSHNSFDQPALLGLSSFKPPEHGPLGAARAARILGVPHAIAGASNMQWCEPLGAACTRKVIRRGPSHFEKALAEEAPETRLLPLEPGDAWSREGGVERARIEGRPAPRVAHDATHLHLGTGERHCESEEPSTEELFRRDLPARTAAVADASRYVGQRVLFEIEGDDAACFSVDFRHPGSKPVPGDDGAEYAVRLPEADWKALFKDRLPWQVLLVCDRLRVTRVKEGAPPDGLHFVFALQAVFP